MIAQRGWVFKVYHPAAKRAKEILRWVDARAEHDCHCSTDGLLEGDRVAHLYRSSMVAASMQ